MRLPRMTAEKDATSAFWTCLERTSIPLRLRAWTMVSLILSVAIPSGLPVWKRGRALWLGCKDPHLDGMMIAQGEVATRAHTGTEARLTYNINKHR